MSDYNGPPPINSIVDLELEPDELYQLGSLFGHEGTWHRLWGILAMEASGLAAPDDKIVEELHDELAGLIGRHLTEDEFAALKAHAIQHGKEKLAPIVDKARSDGLFGD
jgi:muconolactone delta-isomerase